MLKFENADVSAKRQAEIEAAEKKRARVDELGKKSEAGEDLVYDLAKKEDEVRDVLKGKGIKDDRRSAKKESVMDALADYYSDETLEKLEVLRNLKEAEKESLTDHLTGLRNKKALNEEVPKILQMAEREGKNCAILMIDMDHFKNVNDEYGHEAGDITLKALADILQQNVRKYDFVYRYGGEEFAILLFDADKDGSMKRAEQLRQKIKSANIKISYIKDGKEEQKILNKTVSIGFCSTDQIGGEYAAKKMIGKADQALYRSKENGRNRVTSCSEIDDSGVN